MQSFVRGFFHFAQFSSSSMSQHVISTSFLFIVEYNNIPLYGLYHVLFTHSSVDRHFATGFKVYFLFLTLVYKLHEGKNIFVVSHSVPSILHIACLMSVSGSNLSSCAYADGGRRVHKDSMADQMLTDSEFSGAELLQAFWLWSVTFRFSLLFGFHGHLQMPIAIISAASLFTLLPMVPGHSRCYLITSVHQTYAYHFEGSTISLEAEFPCHKWLHFETFRITHHYYTSAQHVEITQYIC